MKKEAFPFYPLLIAFFPILALLSVNISQVPISFAWRAAAISLAIGVTLFGLARLVLRSWGKAALLSTWLLILFFSYGHVFGLIEGLKIGNFDIGRHRYLVIIWGILAVVGCFLILRFVKKPKKLNDFLNIMSIFLIAIPIVQMIYSSVKLKTAQNEQVQTSISAVNNNSDKPDVYYIILDQYTRSDMLAKYHKYDNSEFITKLTDLGFYVAPCSQSNYSMTAFSLASSLNMNYLENVNENAIKQHINWTVFGANIQHNLLQKIFTEMGYTTISFENGITWADIKSSDIFISPKSNPANRNQAFTQVAEFEMLFWRTTLFRFGEDYNGAFWYKWFLKVKSPDEVQYERVLFDMDQLDQISSIKGPKFVYLHLVSPHEPYVIDANGNYAPNPDHLTGYLQQISYLDNKLPEVLQTIISTSKTEPIIVVQADHGDSWEERMAILNAYYFPGKQTADLYPTITPVNTFRIILDKYFGQSLPKLPDISYLTRYDQDYYNFQQTDYGCNLSK